MTTPDGMNLPPLQWLNALETGIAEIDGDHRQLIDDANRILEALRREAPILELAVKMRADCREHFRREERVLTEQAFAGTEAHAAEHRRIEQELDALVQRIAAAADDARARREPGMRFRWILVDHFLHFDLRYKSHLLDSLGL